MAGKFSKMWLEPGRPLWGSKRGYAGIYLVLCEISGAILQLNLKKFGQICGYWKIFYKIFEDFENF